MFGILALYKCKKCSHEFVGQPGPTQCQSCGHVYVEWVNYSPEEFKVEDG